MSFITKKLRLLDTSFFILNNHAEFTLQTQENLLDSVNVIILITLSLYHHRK